MKFSIISAQIDSIAASSARPSDNRLDAQIFEDAYISLNSKASLTSLATSTLSDPGKETLRNEPEKLTMEFGAPPPHLESEAILPHLTPPGVIFEQNTSATHITTPNTTTPSENENAQYEARFEKKFITPTLNTASDNISSHSENAIYAKIEKTKPAPNDQQKTLPPIEATWSVTEPKPDDRPPQEKKTASTHTKTEDSANYTSLPQATPPIKNGTPSVELQPKDGGKKNPQTTAPLTATTSNHREEFPQPKTRSYTAPHPFEGDSPSQNKNKPDTQSLTIEKSEEIKRESHPRHQLNKSSDNVFVDTTTFTTKEKNSAAPPTPLPIPMPPKISTFPLIKNTNTEHPTSPVTPAHSESSVTSASTPEAKSPPQTALGLNLEESKTSKIDQSMISGQGNDTSTSTNHRPNEAINLEESKRAPDEPPEKPHPLHHQKPATIREAFHATANKIIRNEIGGLEITLTPEELGTIKINISNTDRLQVHFLSDRPETIELMRRNSEILERQLQNDGFDEATVSFSSSSHRDDSNQRRQSNIHTDQIEIDEQPIATPTDATSPLLHAAVGKSINLRL